jgi:hypothetical protein
MPDVQGIILYVIEIGFSLGYFIIAEALYAYQVGASIYSL